MKRLFNYFSESRAELAKVNWPTRREAAGLTVAVLIFTVVISIFVGGLDFIFSYGLQTLILKG